MRSILAILLFSCLKCFGQFGVEQPFFLQSSQSSTRIPPVPGLVYWWVASDITAYQSNGDQVNNWTDRVSGAVLFATTNKPYLQDSNCLQFYKTNWMQLSSARPVFTGAPAAPASSITNNAILFIAKHNQYANGGTFLGSTNTVDYASITVAVPPSQFKWGNSPVGQIASNNIFEVLACPYTNSYVLFTNGIWAFNAANQQLTGLKFVGVDDAFTAGLMYIGRIYEIIVWSNKNTMWYDTNIAAMHNYSTNVYSYSP